MNKILIDRQVVEQALHVAMVAEHPVKLIASLRAALAEPAQHPPGEYHGWVLREVLFDNGEPVGHREPVQEPDSPERRCGGPGCDMKCCQPVAWIEHEWAGTGLRKLHFEKRDPTVRDEVVNPVWTPLYTAPPQRPGGPQEPVLGWAGLGMWCGGW